MRLIIKILPIYFATQVKADFLTTLISRRQLAALRTLLQITNVGANGVSQPLEQLRTFNESEEIQNLGCLTKMFENTKAYLKAFSYQQCLP